MADTDRSPQEAPPDRPQDEGSHRDHTLVSALLLVALFTACLVLVLVATQSLVRSRRHHREQAETEALNLCSILADNLLSTYGKIDLALLSVKDEAERQWASAHPDGPRMEDLIRRQRSRIPALASLRTVDPEGFVAFGNDISPGTRIDLTDRPYFQQLKKDPAAGLVFTPPLMGRIKTTWVILMARRIDRPDGSFGGLVYSGIDLAALGAHFNTLVMKDGDTVILRGTDMGVIIQRGGPQDSTGQKALSPECLALLQAGHTRGTYLARTALDGVPRIHAFRKLEPFGHILHVGLATDNVYAPWRRECRQTLTITGFALLFLLGAAWMAHGAWRRRQQAEAERERTIQELRQALSEVNTLSGMLPICSGCKKIRDDQGYWNQIEGYLATHAKAQFTHGLCPDCAHEYFPEFARRKPPE